LSRPRPVASLRRNANQGFTMIIPPNWTLPDAVRSRLGQNTYGRQRAIFEEGHLLLVLHQPPGPDDEERQGVLFWRPPGGEWQTSRGGGGAGGGSALKRHIQSYSELETKLSNDFDKGPDMAGLFDLLDALVPLGRAARNLHSAVQSGRESIKGDTLLIEFRDLAYDVERRFDLLAEDVRLAIQFRTAKEAEDQARLGREALRASHRLNMLAAFFFPLTAIGSLFGMNLRSGLDTDSVAMFFVVLGAGLVLGFAVKGWVTRRERPEGSAGNRKG
jgi:hypothetical protein